MNKDYMPIADLLEQQDSGLNVVWDINPEPYVNACDIGVNITATQRILRMAGLSGAVVIGYQGDQTHLETTGTSVTGINADGSATGSASGRLVKAERQRSALDRSYAGQLYHHWPVAHLGINRRELASNISTDVINHQTPEEVAWARHVNRAFGAAIVHAARQNLVTEPLRNIGERFGGKVPYEYIVQGLYVYGLVTAFQSPFHLFPVAAYQGLTYLEEINRQKKLTGTVHRELMRPSLFPFWFQPDRLAVTALKTKTQPLVKAIGKS